jgi:hypothetical protein
MEMMKSKYLFVLLAVVFGACQKMETMTMIPPVPPVLLKDIVQTNLPSPYYHFEYNADANVTAASFEAGFKMYAVSYKNNKINWLKNNTAVNNDTLQYSYDNAGHVTLIKYVDEWGMYYKNCSFTYDGKRLISMEWAQKIGMYFMISRVLEFVYQTDGNLMQMTDSRKAVGGQMATTLVSKFSQYDTKTNTDGFMLMHDEADHLLLLPAVQLQINNPAKMIRIGDGLNYTVNYSYTYNWINVPIAKVSEVTITSGANAGQAFQTNTTYSYY